ncbi:MAG: LiaI-LiaF-like domain-containing protein [Candidatus Caldipriscus sp.]
MGSIIVYLIIALVGVVLLANNWGFEISIKRDWPVILIILGILGILREIFKR